MAMPSDPGESGSAASTARPAPVRSLGDGYTLALQAVAGAREGEGAAPLAGARLGGEPAHALLGVVERLRDGRVRLVRAGRGAALVLVEDPGRGPQGALQV